MGSFQQQQQQHRHTHTHKTRSNNAEECKVYNRCEECVYIEQYYWVLQAMVSMQYTLSCGGTRIMHKINMQKIGAPRTNCSLSHHTLRVLFPIFCFVIFKYRLNGFFFHSTKRQRVCALACVSSSTTSIHSWLTPTITMISTIIYVFVYRTRE